MNDDRDQPPDRVKNKNVSIIEGLHLCQNMGPLGQNLCLDIDYSSLMIDTFSSDRGAVLRVWQ